MARARNIKPGFFKNEDLAECAPFARLCFAGLWTLADREGRLEDRPKRIKGELFPFDSVEVDPLLEELAKWKFIARYESAGVAVIQILEFKKHQTPHFKEVPSELPPMQSPGLDHHSTDQKPKASPPLNDGETQDKPEAQPPLDGGSAPRLEGGSAAPESGSLIPDTPSLIVEPGVNTLVLTDESSRPNREPDIDLLGHQLNGRAPKTVPDCPHLEILGLWAEVMPDLPQHDPEMWPESARADHLRARWRATAALKGWPSKDEGLRYFRKLFGWCRSSDFLMGKAQTRDRRPFEFELAWLVNATNWTKVHEGKFHG